MRLSKQEITDILSVLRDYFPSIEFRLYLYGSRTQDHLKGGDIDLLVLVKDDPGKFLEKKWDLLVDIKERIGDQKIDLIIASEKQCSEDLFLKTALAKAILLEKNK